MYDDVVVDYTLETLLDLNGFIAEITNGFWFKIEARKVRVDINKPHGIKYSLSLHSPEGERILGFDNAHSVPHFSARCAHDHIHTGEKTKMYNYINAEKLLQDFWVEVDNVLKRRGVKC